MGAARDPSLDDGRQTGAISALLGAKRPVEDHGATPLVLVAFDDELAADHFLRVARKEREHARVDIPLFISDADTLANCGPFGPAWRSNHRRTPGPAIS